MPYFNLNIIFNGRLLKVKFYGLMDHKILSEDNFLNRPAIDKLLSFEMTAVANYSF